MTIDFRRSWIGTTLPSSSLSSLQSDARDRASLDSGGVRAFTSRPGWLVLAVLIAVMLAGCAETEPTIPTVIEKPLPVTRFLAACRGIGLDAVLVGDPRDPRSTWLETSDGHRIELVWPPRHTARFGPLLEVLGPDGAVLFRQGDRVSGACTQGPAEAPTSMVLIQTTDIVGGG